MRTLDDAPYPGSFWAIGRSTTVAQTTMEDPESGAIVSGLIITVSGFDETATLLDIQLFIADPDQPPPPDPPEEPKDLEEPGGLEPIGGVTPLGGVTLN